MQRPSDRVLDLFAVPDDVRPLAGGQGTSVVAGDLVLSPGHDPDLSGWLSPVIARLGVRLSERGAGRPGLRLAIPVPARDGSWVVDGWAATTYVEGATACRDLDILLATADLLHARLAVAVPRRPDALDVRTDRWAVAERAAFAAAPSDASGLAADLWARCRPIELGPDQLVHADLAGNVLVAPDGAAVVIDFSPAWRPALWARAVVVLDAVVGNEADPRAMAAWGSGRAQQAMLRATLFRLLSDEEPDETRYAEALAGVL